MQVPIGARYVGIPGTESEEHPQGFMVEVYWEQDDFGALCIAGHSQRVPVPPCVKLNSPTTNNRRNLGSARPIHGAVTDQRKVSSVNFIR